jgi:hypothetical protein
MMAYLIGLATVLGVAPVLEAEVAVAVLATQGTEIKHTVAIESSDRISAVGEWWLPFNFEGYGLQSRWSFCPAGAHGLQGQKRQSNHCITKVNQFRNGHFVGPAPYYIPCLPLSRSYSSSLDR